MSLWLATATHDRNRIQEPIWLIMVRRTGEIRRRAAKEPIDDVANVFADYLFAADGGFVKIGAVLERAFRVPLFARGC